MFIDPLFPLLAQPNSELSVFMRLPHYSLDYVMSPIKWLCVIVCRSCSDLVNCWAVFPPVGF